MRGDSPPPPFESHAAAAAFHPGSNRRPCDRLPGLALAAIGAASRPAIEGAQKVGETIGRYGALRRALKARLEPAAATGLALTLALLVVIGGSILSALLAYLVRSNAHLHEVDNGVAKWGSAHASAFSTDGLNVVTQFGGAYVVIALSIVLTIS